MTEEVHKLLLLPRRGGRVTRAGPPLLPIERLAGLQERKAPAVSGAARGCRPQGPAVAPRRPRARTTQSSGACSGSSEGKTNPTFWRNIFLHGI